MLSAGSWQKWSEMGHRFFRAQKHHRSCCRIFFRHTSMKFSAELIDEGFNHQSHGLICTGKTMAFESYLPKRGFLKIPSQSEKIPLNPMGFTWFSYVFPTNFMAFRPRIPRLLQGARPHQGSRTETGSILVAGAGTMPLAASAMVIWEVLPNKTPLEGNTLW